MIWNHQRDAGGSDELAAYVAAELEGAGPERPDAAREAARAVAAFIRERHANEVLPAEYLALLIARSLWAVGEEAAACRFLEVKGAAWRVGPAFSGAALAPDISVARWRAMLGARMVRSFSTLARGAIWILDLQRLLEPGRSGLELAVFRALNAVLDQIAGVWDATRGQGILGLRHLNAAASRLLDCPPGGRKSSAMALDIQRQCELRLRAAGQTRDWRAVPEVIRL